MNIKVGDKVCRLNMMSNFPIVKTVKAINPQTISVADYFEYQGRTIETSVEPRQSPDNWRVCIPDLLTKAELLSQEIQQKEKELQAIMREMPKVSLLNQEVSK